MRQNHYCRLHEAYLAMANQSTEPEVQARWLVMADAWFKRSLELSKHPGVISMGQARLGRIQSDRTQMRPTGDNI
jgi:hypothetical protein